MRHRRKQLGITTVSVTHDQVEALVMSDVIAILDQGKLQQIGPPLQVYRRPVNQFVADFIGESNLLAGRVAAADAGPMFQSMRGLAVPLAPGAESRERAH